MGLASGIDKVRTKLAAKASKFMPDLCDILNPVSIDQGAGHTIKDNEIALNIPCTIGQVGGSGVQFHDGESVINKTVSIELPYTSTTAAIKRNYKLRVHARGVNPQMTLEQPVIKADSMSPLLEVVAVLTEGYRIPAIR